MCLSLSVSVSRALSLALSLFSLSISVVVLLFFPLTSPQPVDIDDYNDLHAFPIKTPGSMFDYDEDDAFARQRLQGKGLRDAPRILLRVLGSP